MVVGFPGIGVWRSPVAHLLWEQGAGGSNPLTPTTLTSPAAPSLCGGLTGPARSPTFAVLHPSAGR